MNPLVEAQYPRFRSKLDAYCLAGRNMPAVEHYRSPATFAFECMVRALDRRIARRKAEKQGERADAEPGWLGENLCLKVDARAVAVLSAVFAEDYQLQMQQAEASLSQAQAQERNARASYERVQALFGLDRHPVIGRAGGEPLLLKLTSPAGRPKCVTRPASSKLM